MSITALVILAPGFEEIEAITVVDILRRADIDVTTAGTVGGVIAASRGTRHVADHDLEAVQDRIFDLVVLPGGIEGTANLAADDRVRDILSAQAASSRYIGAICAAPTALHAFDLIHREDTYTCHPGARAGMPTDNLRPDDRVVVSRRLITSQSAGTAMEFAYALVRELQGEEKLEQVDAGVLAPVPSSAAV
ncbi:MAG: DJ-1 family glyoxalase III [Verrucomicrobiota bacterium]